MNLASLSESAGRRGTKTLRSLLYRSTSSALVAVLAFVVVGCAALGGGPAPLDTYELTAPSLGKSGGRGRAQILIAEPSALKSLDGQNLVVRTSATGLQFLKGAQWSDRLPRIVQARLAETFQSSGAFAGVGKPGEGLAIDYQIITEIRAFDIDARGGGSRAEVELFVRLTNDRNGTVRASRVFRASGALSGQGNNAYANGLDSAFGQVAKEIVAWVDSKV